ncbi:IclR family transcriptional regulator [Rhizobiales bacterium]|uniref:IclR family transcriptional regulator n=1 Tax=Hongsoonwoonella zoysiae TaxID=2821844 RepID=UPI00156136EF|nr:IclR family transcriptional regulator [Hongsoonwoonella zoysiae]NRG16386.1 IclR family transcriptional regulator [Hongsoonwoonella zoysiae]
MTSANPKDDGTGERGVEAVERALRILDCFDGADKSLSLAELSRRSGLYKSTILRLATSLSRFGYLRRERTGHFRLGPALWRLGALYRSQFDMEEVVRPKLDRLVEATGESASFYIREDNFRVCLYRRNSPRAIRHHLDEGARFPLDESATSKVLRSFAGASQAPGDSTVTDGFATSVGARDPDVASVSAPVFDRLDRLVAALTVSGLAGRFTSRKREDTVNLLKSCAREIARELPD